MSRNIKEIGKELLGKSLNSFHRKTGLTQLEKNNEMQDGILDGILSQVDDVYIEKTEQSNIINLEGSGDGVVVIDNIEGNTMINLWDENKLILTNQATLVNHKIKITTTDNVYSNFFNGNKSMFKPNTEYTFIVNISKNTLNEADIIFITSYSGSSSIGRDIFTPPGNGGFIIKGQRTGVFIKKLTTIEDFSLADYSVRSFIANDSKTPGCEVELSITILEGDYTNKPIPSEFFEGMKSCFEDKLIDDINHPHNGKYEAELKVVGKNLFHYNIPNHYTNVEKLSNGYKLILSPEDAVKGKSFYTEIVRVKKNVKYILSAKIDLSRSTIEPDTVGANIDIVDGATRTWMHGSALATTKGVTDIKTRFNSGNHDSIRLQFFIRAKISGEVRFIDIQLEEDTQPDMPTTPSPYEPYKEHIQTLYLDEPLYKDNELCIHNGQLGYWKNREKVVLDGGSYFAYSGFVSQSNGGKRIVINKANIKNNSDIICNNRQVVKWSDSPWLCTFNAISTQQNTNDIYVYTFDDSITDLGTYKHWLQTNPTTIIYELTEPIFIPVENEYGNPMLLEGYENGTLYIDSNIVPTTTTRYTPKMESVRTLKEVNNDNRTLHGDINNNIIPYMMDVDFMITEKEMALTSHKNTFSRIGENNMTSMQKRTKEMLERLFKGKSLTKEECLTRITVYLSAGKITDEQAEELMLFVEEIYA